jgi:hypothetical protein
MGEWSRKIGEHGEDVVSELFELIGWADAQKNLTIPCLQGQRHSNGTSVRTTHGIDSFFSYKSRLVDRTLDHLVMSIKYSSNPYPASINLKFKEHFIDLAKTIECFKRSSLRSQAGKQFSGINNARNIGVLFWLTNDRSNESILSKVASVRKVDDFAYETIFVVDDSTASFLFDSIHYIKGKYAEDSVDFLYHFTGRNINPATRETSGTILPVEFVNSPILPFRITKIGGAKILALSCAKNFHVDRLRRLIGLAQNLTQDFAQETVILFPDYDRLVHDNSVKEAKVGFKDNNFTESVKVASFHTGFRELEQ